ncbi:MAG TPA: TIM-barrel domain-containing protein [Isosphaeraceae bacterium]|nr:TIM-barrel domain-containing protein [Isosphaeraceae bacterium]
MPLSRRAALKALGASGATPVLGSSADAGQPAALRVAGRPVEVAITPIDPHMVRVSVVGLKEGRLEPIPSDGSLVHQDWGSPLLRLTKHGETHAISRGDDWRLSASTEPITVRVEAADRRLIQQVHVDGETGGFVFHLGDGPVLGLGEGGPQFDRRGSVDRMRSGQGGYRLRTHGGRVPVPWLIGTAGWAMFVHQPAGTFDLTGAEGRFTPARPAAALPLDLFLVTARDPARVMAALARLTGHAELPPLWSLGYQQSHRTLASREEVLAVARTFREKKLPCDVLIYLGTGFCPSGWNTGHGSFTFNPPVFPNPGDDRRAARDALPRGASRGHPLEVAPRERPRCVRTRARGRRPCRCILAGASPGKVP